MGPLTQPAFVDEDDGLVLACGVFFNAGKRRFFQRRIASSFRSKARPTGRWQLQPSCFNSRQTWVKVTAHRTLARSNGPRAGWSTGSCYIPELPGPVEPLLDPFQVCGRQLRFPTGTSGPFNPARPACSSCRAQRLTDWRWTPTRRATSDWWTPCSSNRAAFKRRCSRVLKHSASRLNPRVFPMAPTVAQITGNVTILCKCQ